MSKSDTGVGAGGGNRHGDNRDVNSNENGVSTKESNSSSSSGLINDSGISNMVSPTMSEEGWWSNGNSTPSDSTTSFPMVADDLGFEGCSLEKMPSFDAEWLWEVLANY